LLAINKFKRITVKPGDILPVLRMHATVGSSSAWEIIKHSPHLEDIWQLHFSVEGGKDHNAPEEYIANPDGPDAANYLLLNGNSDGSFSIFNSRTQKTKRYSTR
jgi:competence protein ComEC